MKLDIGSITQVSEDSHFPIENIPFGVCHLPSGETRCCSRIGDIIIDLSRLEQAGIFRDLDFSQERVFAQETLNVFLSHERPLWTEARKTIQKYLRTLSSGGSVASEADAFYQANDTTPVLPMNIGDFTDFYASRWHASNVGKMFRPDGEPLLPNWLHLPVGYHGRSSTIVASGTDVRRPSGQLVPPDNDQPIDAACRLLDFEFEMGAFYGGPSNELGHRIPMKRAANHLFGMCLVNDWSARDIQKWEYVPLGPFNAKNFQTSIGTWIVTFDALEPFRIPQPERIATDPEVLEYLRPIGNQGVEITLETLLLSQEMAHKGLEPVRIMKGNFRDIWWSFEQMLAHHTSTGCRFRPGDLMASGTVSGEKETSRGSLLELSWRGTTPISLPDGSERKFLQDGDTVTMSAYCQGDGYRVGFGEVTGTILPAR